MKDFFLKYKLFLIISLVIVVSAGVFVVGYIASSSKDSLSDSSLYENKYYVEKGLEKYATLVINSVENFNKQDSSESVALRNKRLGNYFTGDSPVYGYSLDNLDSTYNKSEATVTSITNCPDNQDAVNVCFSAMINLVHKSNSDQSSEQVRYWVAVKKDENGQYKTYDLGIWQ